LPNGKQINFRNEKKEESVSKQGWDLPTIYTDPIHNKQGQRLNVGLYGIVYILLCERLQIQLQWLKI